MKDAIIIVSITKNKVAQSVADLYSDYSIHSIDGQYLDYNIIKLGKNETFIDTGAFDLATSKEFKKYCMQYDFTIYIIGKKYVFIQCSWQKIRNVQRKQSFV